jgi:hypothetical protein
MSKRTLTALVCAALSLSAGLPALFADDGDAVLEEARRRAQAAEAAAADAERAAEEASDAVEAAVQAAIDAAEAAADAAADDYDDEYGQEPYSNDDPEDDELFRATLQDTGDDVDTVYLPLDIAFVPGLSGFGRPVDASVSLAPIMSIVHGIDGAQVSGIGNIVESDLHGFQGAGVFNIAGDDVSGFQAAGVFNLADCVAGGQGAGVFNIAEGSVAGFAGAGVFNINAGGGPVMLAGVFNISGGTFYGLQGAGVFNIAEDVYGVQAAGVFNIARDVAGLQIGVVNVAENVAGFQLGLVNIVTNGINDTGLWLTDSGDAAVFMARGNVGLYTLSYAGLPKDDVAAGDFSKAYAGLGLGWRFGPPRDGVAIDLDVSAKARVDAAAVADAVMNRTSYLPAVAPAVRASIRVPLFLGLAVHAGVNADVQIAGGPAVDPLFVEADAKTTELFGRLVTFYPRWFVALSF